MQKILTRNRYFDFLRGIAILFVVGIHTFPKHGFDTVLDWFCISLRQIMNCAVPVFLAISGFFVGQKSFVSSSDFYKAFILKQVKKIYIPCIVFSVPYFVLDILNGRGFALSVAKLFLCAYSVYYFVALILQCYCILPLANRLGNNTVLLTGGGGVTVIALLSISYITKVRGLEVPLFVYAAPFPTWILYFALGVVLARNSREYKLLPLIILLVVSLVLCDLESLFCYEKFSKPSFGIKISACLFSATAVLVLFSKKAEESYKESFFLNRALAFFGENSFAVYLTHCLVLMLLEHFIKIDLWILKFAIVFGIDFLCVCLAKIILPKGLCNLIGVVK